MQTKIKNLATGQVLSQNFQQSDKFEEAEIIKEKIVFIYANKNKGEYWFHKEGDPSKRFSLSENQVEDIKSYLKSGPGVELLKFNDQIIGIELPIKIDFKVIEAPPDIKGSTAQGGSKSATIETGAKINVPLFINEGDIITVNTKTGEYVQRAR